MKSYPISKEFRLIRHFTPPLTTPILPVCNLFLEGMALGVRSDKAVTVTRFALSTDDGRAAGTADDGSRRAGDPAPNQSHRPRLRHPIPHPHHPGKRGRPTFVYAKPV